MDCWPSATSVQVESVVCTTRLCVSCSWFFGPFVSNESRTVDQWERICAKIKGVSESRVVFGDRRASVQDGAGQMILSSFASKYFVSSPTALYQNLSVFPWLRKGLYSRHTDGRHKIQN